MGQRNFYRSAYISTRDISIKVLDYTVFIDSTYYQKGKHTDKMFQKVTIHIT